MLLGWHVHNYNDACRPRGGSADDTDLTVDITTALQPGCFYCCSVN